MAKFVSKHVAKEIVEPVSSKKTKFTLEMLQADFLHHTVQIIGGKKLTVGAVYDCIKVGNGKFGLYLMIDDHGTNIFVNPGNVKVLKALDRTKAAVVAARVEEEASATLLLPVTIKQETEKAVCFKWSGGFQPIWMPKQYLVRVGETDTGQDILEITRWRLGQAVGPEAIEQIEKLQASLEKTLEPAPAPAKTTRKGK